MGCSVCDHDERQAIEAAAHEAGADTRELAVRWGVTKAALVKHVATHPRAAATAPSAKKRRRAPSPAASPDVTSRRATSPDVAPPPRNALVALEPTVDEPEEPCPPTSRSPTSASTARGKLDDLLVSLKKLADGIGADATVSERIAVFRASVAPIKLLGQLTGELGASDSTVAASPHYRRIRTAIIEALKEHPAALQAVEQALAQLEPGRAEKAA